MIVNLSKDTSFAKIGTLRGEILILSVQICFHVHTRALAVWSKQIAEAHRNLKQKSKKKNKPHIKLLLASRMKYYPSFFSNFIKDVVGILAVLQEFARPKR